MRNQNYVCVEHRQVARGRARTIYPRPLCRTCREPMMYVEHPPAREDDRGWAELRRLRAERERREHARSWADAVRDIVGWRPTAVRWRRYISRRRVR